MSPRVAALLAAFATMVAYGTEARAQGAKATSIARTVNRSHDAKPGAIAFWAGNNSRGDYANLKITPATNTK